MPKKVLFLDHADILGGAEQSLLLLVKHLPKDKYEPLIGCQSNSPLAKAAAQEGLTTLPLAMPQLKGVRSPLALWRQLFSGAGQIQKAIKTNSIDIIHGNVFRASIYGALAALFSRKPFVWHVRDLEQQEKFLAFFIGLKAGKILAISQAVRQALPRLLHSKTVVVPNAVPVAALKEVCSQTADLKKKLGLAPETHLIGNISWLAPWKGQDLFLEAAARVLKKTKRNVYFVIVGDVAHPKHKQWLAKLKSKAENLAGRVIFTGALANVWEAVCSLDILVHCAYLEPFGRVLLEAMVCQKPVVAFAGGGVDEIVKDNQTGYLIPYRDVDLMAEKLLELIDNPEKRQQFGVNGYERVRQKFDIKKQIEQIDQVYSTLLKAL